MPGPDESMSGTDRRDAWEEDECLLCAPANHPNCEKYAILEFRDPSNIPLGESDEDHTVEVPVCMGHYEALQQFQSGKNVEEVDVP